jgi:hypothetical protein
VNSDGQRRKGEAALKGEQYNYVLYVPGTQ